MEKPKNPPTPEEVISSENNNQRTPNTVGGTLPPTAPECLEAPKESGLLRSLGRRVLGCLWPDEKQKIEDTDARTPAPQPSSESVDDARSLEDEGDEAVVHESADEIEEGYEMTITLLSKKQGRTKDTTAREPLKIRLVKKFLGAPWLPGEPLIYIDDSDRPTEGWTNVHPYIRKCFKDWKMTTPEVVAMTQENPFSTDFIGDDRDSSLQQDSNTSQEPVRHTIGDNPPIVPVIRSDWTTEKSHSESADADTDKATSEPTVETYDGEIIAISDIPVPGGNVEVELGKSSSRIVHAPRRPTPLGMRTAKAVYRVQTRPGWWRSQK